MKIFKVIIAGSRSFDDYNLLKKQMDLLLANKIAEGYKIIIVSGTTRGADKLGERYARERHFEISSHPADWDRYGKAAGMIRNGEMGREADALVAFWDNKSPGTKGMIDIMYRLNKPYRIIEY